MIRRSRIFWRFTLASISLICLILSVVYFLCVHHLHKTHHRRNVTALTAQAQLDDLAAARATLFWHIAAAALLLSVGATGLSLLAARRLRRSLDELERGIQALSLRQPEPRLGAVSLSAFVPLVQALNRLVSRAKAEFDAAINQRNEFAAVVSSMDEGVVGLDMEGRILNINPAALVMIDKAPAEVKGRPLYQVIRNRQLGKFVERATQSGYLILEDMQMHEYGNRVWQVRAAPLQDVAKRRMGTLLMLNDVTRLRRLETMRKDFVANVSHELKTPLTAIKGFVETLDSGAVDDPVQAKRFLQIINNHVNRLTAIVDDLLQLSRFEKEGEIKQIRRERVDLRRLIGSCAMLYQPRAAEKKVRLDYAGEPPVPADVDIALIEQALVNLIDNAVKYCPEKSRVTIDAVVEDGEIVLSVADNGMGIPKNSQARLFERFYRVDRNRSRKLGGTGLGLAIVKHIARMHGGRVAIDSTVGKGSSFYIYLPVASPTERVVDAPKVPAMQGV